MVTRAPNAVLSFILSELNESEETLRAQGIAANELLLIYNDYTSRLPELEDIAVYVSQKISKLARVHATKYRIKDPLHLLQKIIRKKKEYPQRTINHLNYLDYINDLAGVRALYVYKSDLIAIGQHIPANWQLKRRARAYTKPNEAQEHLQFLADSGCKIVVHPAGYSAVHFVIETRPGKQRYFAEIQVRTLYEEAWSEIDHHIRYPNHEHSALLDELLQVLNKLTGYAEVTATHIRELAREVNKPMPDHRLKQEIATKLLSHIQSLPIPETEKQQFYLGIDKIM